MTHLDADPSALPEFRPRAPWWTGDLQTLRNTIVRPRPDLADWPERRICLPLSDSTGDCLIGRLNDPLAAAPARPMIVLLHGLTGSAESVYMRVSARYFLKRGHRVLRLNLRGAGETRPLCRFQYHAGRSQDLGDALNALAPELTRDGVILIGYSLAGNMLLKFMSEAPARSSVLAAASISAPIDLKAAQARIMAPRNRIYHAHLLAGMKAELLATPELPPAIADAARAATTVYEYDEKVVAVRGGFAGAEDYYRRCSALPRLPAIGTPCLVIHALDDPWIPGAIYQSIEWRKYPCLRPLLPSHGGHVGFHGRGARLPWHNLAIERFIAPLIGPA